MYRIINRKKLLLTAAADLIGHALFMPYTLLAGRNRPITGPVRSILVIRTAYIGDVMMTVPMLKPLKEGFPDAGITFLTSSGAKPLLVGNPFIDRVIDYNPFWFYSTSGKEYVDFIRKVQSERYDLVIEARGDIREILMLAAPLKARYKVSYDVGGGAYLLTHVVPYRRPVHKVEYHLDIARFLGCPVKGVEWGVYLTDEERDAVDGIVEGAGIRGPFVSVHPGSRVPLKKWPGERYAELYDKVGEEMGLPVAILGSRQELPEVESIAARMRRKPVVLAGKLDLRQLAGVLAKSTLFICNDSGPMHIAAAMNTPAVALFGPSKSCETGPFNAASLVVEKDYPCRFTCDEGVCTNTVRHACMKAVSTEDVMRAVKEVAAKL